MCCQEPRDIIGQQELVLDHQHMQMLQASEGIIEQYSSVVNF